jgi:hypothetical protein
MNAQPELPLTPIAAQRRPLEIIGTHPLEADAGHVIVASDCHYLPDEPASTAHRALVRVTSRKSPCRGRYSTRGSDERRQSRTSRRSRVTPA